MRDFKVERVGNELYLEYYAANDSELDVINVGKITSYGIYGLAPVSLTLQPDGSRCLKYNISNKITLYGYLQSAKKSELLKIIGSIAQTLIFMNKRAIPYNAMVFEKNRIYVDVEAGMVAMVCLPLANNTEAVDLRAFFKDVMASAVAAPQEDNSYMKIVIDYIDNAQNFDMADFKAFLLEVAEGKLSAPVPPVSPMQPQVRPGMPPMQPQVRPGMPPVPPMQPQGRQSVPPMQPQVRPGMPPMQPQVRPGMPPMQPQVRPGMPPVQPQVRPPVPPMPQASPVVQQKKKRKLFGGKKNKAQNVPPVNPMPQGMPASGPSINPSIMEAAAAVAGETVDLSLFNNVQNDIKPTLTRLSTGEKILINQDNFRIGREPSTSDYCVRDNMAVGRCHANIIKKEGQYYLIDNNSKNHTYVDGRMVEPQTEQKLSSGMKITLANEDFEFKMM